MGNLEEFRRSMTVIQKLNRKEFTEINNIFRDKASGYINAVPFTEISKFPIELIRAYAWQCGMYGIITTELLEAFKIEIGNGQALEIGAGLGTLGRGLGLQMYDNKIQSEPEVAAYYRIMGQPTINYPTDVNKLDGLEAIKRYKPEVLLLHGLPINTTLKTPITAAINTV